MQIHRTRRRTADTNVSNFAEQQHSHQGYSSLAIVVQRSRIFTVHSIRHSKRTDHRDECVYHQSMTWIAITRRRKSTSSSKNRRRKPISYLRCKIYISVLCYRLLEGFLLLLLNSNAPSSYRTRVIRFISNTKESNIICVLICISVAHNNYKHF